MADYKRSREQNAVLAFTVAAIAGLLATAVASAIRLCKEDRHAGEAEAEAGPELTYTQAKAIKGKLADLEDKLDSTDGKISSDAKRDLRRMAMDLLIGSDSAVVKQVSGEIDLPGLKELAADFSSKVHITREFDAWVTPGTPAWYENVAAIREFDEWAFQHRKAIVTEWALYQDWLAQRGAQAKAAVDDETMGDGQA